MSLEIIMKGQLNPVTFPGDFKSFHYAINLAAAKGEQFVILEREDGKLSSLNTMNIDIVNEVDGDLIG